jgi:heme/copper-type cytochrome/quinol oxidase subunit 4
MWLIAAIIGFALGVALTAIALFPFLEKEPNLKQVKLFPEDASNESYR